MTAWNAPPLQKTQERGTLKSCGGLTVCAEGWAARPRKRQGSYRVGQPARVEIESEWTARKRERAAERLRAAVELPHSSQNRA